MREQGFLSGWLRSLKPGDTLTEADMKILGRVIQCVENADKHHAQAREAQAEVVALKMDRIMGAYRIGEEYDPR